MEMGKGGRGEEGREERTSWSPLLCVLSLNRDTMNSPDQLLPCHTKNTYIDHGPLHHFHMNPLSLPPLHPLYSHPSNLPTHALSLSLTKHLSSIAMPPPNTALLLSNSSFPLASMRVFSRVIPPPMFRMK